MLCALDGVEPNAIDNAGMTTLDVAITYHAAGCVRALLEFNVDTSKARVTARTKVAIVQLLEEYRKQSVKELIYMF